MHIHEEEQFDPKEIKDWMHEIKLSKATLE
jgi:hypothetical protein